MNTDKQLKKAYVTNDNDGHWYVIPDQHKERFDYLLELSEYESNPDWEKHEEEFIDEFSKYMTGGDINETELYSHFD